MPIAVALAFAAAPVLAKGRSGGHGGRSHSSSHGHAQSRSGGSHSGGSHASAAGRAHGRGASGSSSDAGAHHASGSNSERRSTSRLQGAESPRERRVSRSAPPLTDAQRRQPRPGTGRGDRFFGHGVNGRYGRSYFSRSYFNRPYLSLGLGYRYRSRYFDPFFYDYGYPSSYYYDDYDSPAPYRYGSRDVIVDPMVGEDTGDLGAIPSDPDRVPPGEEPDDPYARPLERGQQDAEPGMLRLNVRPPDASIYVDDELRGSGRQLESLRLAAGRHHIDVVRPGYQSVTREIDVRPRETRTLEVDLRPF